MISRRSESAGLPSYPRVTQLLFILCALISCDQSIRSDPTSGTDQLIDGEDQEEAQREAEVAPIRRECRGARCAQLYSGVETHHLTVPLEGRLEGDRVDLPAGEGTWVFWSEDEVELHEVYLDDVRVFDVTRAFEGVEPQLGVRPTGRPLTLVLPSSQSLSILFRAWGPTRLEISRFTGRYPGRTLPIRVLDFTSSLPDVFTRVESLLPIAIAPYWHPLTDAERAQVDAWSHAPHELAIIGDRDLPEIPIIFLAGLPSGVAGRTPSTPLSPYRGEGYILIDVEKAGDRLAQVVAHEVAHALGLLHISEASGAQLEGLEDTPTCLLDRNTDGQLNESDCPQAAQNLMFWSGSGSTLSPNQIQRLSRSPLLQPMRGGDEVWP